MPPETPPKAVPVPPHSSPGQTNATPAILSEFYSVQFALLRQKFEATGDGLAALRARSDLIDSHVLQLHGALFSPDKKGPENLCLVALGGYGRQELFPYSDIDLLFLCANDRVAETHREAIAGVSRTLWDLHLRVGPTTQTLAACGELHRDNLEFNIALLDCRYVAGDEQIFGRLRRETIPHLVARDRQDLVRDLAALSSQRHAKYGHTIFHLEPNVKESPGGLRDYHLGRWLARITELERAGSWAPPEDVWQGSVREESRKNFEFLAAVRCFLHFAHGRDDNQLSYELQDQAAAQGVGFRLGQALPAAEWIRAYFRHARSTYRLATSMLDDAVPSQSSLYGLFQEWRSRVSNADFSVIRGRIFPRHPSLVRENLDLVLGLFEMVARHGLDLSSDAEKAVSEALLRMPSRPLTSFALWKHLEKILVSSHAAKALRDMHRLGLLGALFPEFLAIDALVIRDFFHRYTVDEHTFTAIENLHGLGRLQSGKQSTEQLDEGREWDRRLAEVWSELEQPGLLLLALLFHDVGKGMPTPDHIQGSLEALEGIFARLDFPPEDRETVRFLIRRHLAMSAACQRRDVFDPETVRALADIVETPERLKMLCLLTYADIKAVSPEALTPWKAELLWRLYTATTNYFARSVDQERVEPSGRETAQTERILPIAGGPASELELRSFLQGFPRRYLASHTTEEIAAHFESARRLATEPVQINLRSRDHHFELTVVTRDRPRLFASITGTLAGWGMNIVKADAFANAAGVALDTFRFVDLHRTLELNPSEREKFKTSLAGVLKGEVSLEKLLGGRVNSASLPRAKVRVPTQVRFDDTTSSHSTLLELIAQDRPGLLYQVSSVLAELDCNIEVALIDTEGQKAIDVFYLTLQGAKLNLAKTHVLREALLKQLA